MKKTNEKGITLIALVITIIVMLILLVVAVNVALGDEGILKNAKTASTDTEKKSILEEIMTMVKLDNEGRIDVAETKGKATTRYAGAVWNAPILTVKGRTGTYKYKITTTEISIFDGEIPQLSEFERYIMGEEGTGRSYFDIFGYDDNGEYFISDGETSINPSEIEIKKTYENGDSKYGYYLKYDNKIYKVEIVFENEENVTTQSCELIYEQKGDEGKRVGEVIQESEFSDWIILYEYEDRVEAVSPRTMGGLTLGYEDIPTGGWTAVMEEADIDEDEILSNAEKSIYSYNHAIDTINNACKNLPELASITDKSRIRSAGAKIDSTEEMYFGIPQGWPGSIYNGKLKVIDNAYFEDYMRMLCHEVLDATMENGYDRYWIASRGQQKDFKEIGYRVIREGDTLSSDSMVEFQSDYTIPRNNTYPVLPIITILKNN